MLVSFNIELLQDDRTLLVSTLGCESHLLEHELSRHANAALCEYIEAYLGRRASVWGSDILEFRLALLIKYAYLGSIPGDVKISRLFQTTLLASCALIRNALAKYLHQLNIAYLSSAKAILETVIWPRGNADYYILKDPAVNLVELLNQNLAADDPTMKKIYRLPENGGIYAINIFSYDRLFVIFNAEKVDRI